MKELDELLLLSGQDIPFISAQCQIRQPRIKDIGIVGEKQFYAGVSLINFDKDVLENQDNSVLENISNFEIIMTMIQNPNPETQEMKINMSMVLAILFPDYGIEFQSDKILLTDITENQNNGVKEINKNNFEELKELLDQILCLESQSGEKKLNPKSKMAQRIAEKLKKGRAKAAKSKGENESGSLLGRYVSILSVGEQKDMNQLMSYTLYQLFEEYKRYSTKLSFDMNMSARLAGAKDVSTPKNWMDNLDESPSSS